MATGEFFLEVRCEEIPARMLGAGVAELGSRLFEELMGRNIAPSKVTTGFTPRRLVVTLDGLPEREADRRERQTGPPARVAYDESGQPTKALLGFAERCGIAPSEVVVETTDKGEYLVATMDIAGAATVDVLAEIVPRILGDLSWPKSMRWGASIGPWVRPVHSVVALFDGGVVPFEFFGVRSGVKTSGHPIHSPDTIEVSASADYYSALEKRGILVDFEQRRQALLDGLGRSADEVGGRLVPDDRLLDKLASICAVPGVVRGQIESMDLPREVLITSLRDHQSAFSLESDEGLLPFFLTVMDRSDDPEGRVQRGNEWVVSARLEDARFFYAEDRKQRLVDRREQLRRVTFHERLGSYAEKSDRIVALTGWICEQLTWGDEALEPALEAAALLKADLTTEMVKEFTSLQGIVGGVYAGEEGYPDPVWQAVYDQYQPASTQDSVPRGRAGMLASLADRIDTLVGMFGLGLIPTGSKDPFGLRRVAQGAVRIALEGGMRVDFGRLADHAVGLYGDRLARPAEQILDDLRPFLLDRVRHLLSLEGYAYDEIEAAVAGGGSDLPDLRDRVAALHQVRGEDGFLAVVLAAKRIANIIRDTEKHDLDEELLTEPAEQALFAAAGQLDEALEQAEHAGDHAAGLKRIAEFAGVLDRFFVEVLVMDENPRVRANRFALLQSIHRLLSRSARLTEMVVDRTDSKK